MNCIECFYEGISTEATNEDPRIPPVDEGVCLCFQCFKGAAEERIEELTSEIEALIEEVGHD